MNEGQTIRGGRLLGSVACASTAIVGFWGNVAPVRACVFSNAASAYANGVAARHIATLPSTSAGEALWAPFAFVKTLRPGQPVALREDMVEVARSLGKQVLGWRVRWMFGDGALAPGVAATHTYQKAGVYKISVQSYYTGPRSAKGWYTFDLVDIVVGPLPASATWLKPSRPTPTPAP